MNSHIDVDTPQRVRSLKDPPFSRELQHILHKFQSTEFENVFQTSLLANDDASSPPRNFLGDKGSATKTSDVHPVNQASLIQWRFSGKTDDNRSSRQTELVGSASPPLSPDRSRGYEERDNGAVVVWDNASTGSNETEVTDHDIVTALIKATKVILEKTPKHLNFATVKAQVEQIYGLTSDFWGTSDNNKWFSRSKDVIK